jgi:Gluconate 2-dehydrogenase subunit 3
MSIANRINLRQDRRQWLKTTASVVGASVLPLPTPAAAQPTQESPAAAAGQAAKTAAESKGAQRSFTPAQHALIEELAETIIPADSHSGGAKAAKVADYIEKTLRETTNEDDRALWHEGLRLVDLMSKHYNGRAFVDAAPEERLAVLTVLSDNDHLTELPEVRFFGELKRLTTMGFYTSKVGIHDELEYKGNRILMEYVGCDDPTPKT